MNTLDFENQINALEAKMEELSHASKDSGVDVIEEIAALQKKVDKLLRETYKNLTPWDKVQVARHPERPHCLDYIRGMIDDFTELAGDRNFAEDAAIVAGMGRLNGQTIMIIGHEKGHDMESRMKHNFGMPKPEGYRKVQRLMKLADHYQIPIVTLIDTAGAYPGIDAEERGQAEAIARSIDVGLSVSVPFVAAVIGEGGSGGAIALGTANRVLMMEHAIYSVITPEGCASILWHSADKKKEAAATQKLTAEDLLKLKVIDEIVEEPLGGAHRHHEESIKNLSKALQRNLKDLMNLTPRQLGAQRRQKFLEMGRNI
ncbi:MAG: acetyl-CoA carboxylase carboxyltransferase subunit alpha [Alphaproteobacteria bacterium]